MIPHPTTLSKLLLLCLVLPSASIAQAKPGEVILTDSMAYASDSAMQTAWPLPAGLSAESLPIQLSSVSLAPTPLLAFHPAPASGAFMVLGNGVRCRDLGVNLTGDWSLKARILSTSYSRAQSIFLLNDTGTKGYGILWNSTNVNQNAGNGVVSIRKFNTTYTNWSSFGTGSQLGTAKNPAHPATGYAVTSAPTDQQNAATYNTTTWKDFLDVQLSWDKETGKLTLYLNGAEATSATDTEFKSFRKVFLRGNGNGYFDNVAVSADYGADVPFVTLEAESATTTGQLITITDKAQMLTWPTVTPQQEASGRAYVKLATQGQYVEFRTPIATNTIVLRHSTPDAPGGGGQTRTLAVYVNGNFRQTIDISSKHNWLYLSNPDAVRWDNGQQNVPTDYPHSFWDESRYFITGATLNPGDTIKLQKDSANTAAFYSVDLIDVELAPAALTAPADSLSVITYGANGSDDGADHVAISNCITAAKGFSPRKTVWIPEGSYRIQGALPALDGVKIQGAGMWRTTIEFDCASPIGSLFGLTGNGASVSDLMISSRVTVRRGSEEGVSFYAFGGGTGTNWAIRRCWVTHSGAAFWIGGSDGVIEHCRVRSTYADGINTNNGNASNSSLRIRIENNHVRGTGDDGIALLSATESSGKTNSTIIRRNTSIAPWWGTTCAIAGGDNHLVEDNYFADGPGLAFNLNTQYPSYPVVSATVRGNLLVRCGTPHSRTWRGAVWIYAAFTTISSSLLENNIISGAIYRGIHLTSGRAQHITFRGNLVQSPGEDGFYIDSSVTGSGTFENNRVTGLILDAQGKNKQFDNNSPAAAYPVVLTGNSWP